MKGWDAATREELRIAASVSALRGEANGVRLHDVAREALALAEGGLKARNRLDAEGRDETVFLATLRDRVASGKVPADRLLDLYDGEWGRDLSRIYASQQY